MISVEKFHSELTKLEIDYFTGVPDSTFKDWISYLDDNSSNITNRIAANEGNAIALCTGYYLSTGKVGAVYLQNSGLGNCINPLTSLTDPEVYGIPMIMMIGWRGEPREIDEPQHKKMGEVMLDMLDSIDVPYSILGVENFSSQLEQAKRESLKNNKPYALIVKKGLFETYEKSSVELNRAKTNREDVIKAFVENIESSDLVLSTTGFTSRELYEVSKISNRGHQNNFYNVGTMGHVSSIALEVALQNKDKNVYVLDGDGALIMHMGALATIGYYKPTNLIHVVFDNASYESTGGQTTVSCMLDLAGVMKSCGYDSVVSIENPNELKDVLKQYEPSLRGIVVCIAQGYRKDLGRPTDSPLTTKKRFMRNISHIKN